MDTTSKRPRVFYGWWVVATSALGLCLGAAPIMVFSFGVFFKSLSQDFHVGRAAISFAFTLHNLTSAVSSPFAGRLIDRVGARKVILTGTTLFGLLLLSSKALGAGIGWFYLFYAALGVLSPATTPVPYIAIVSHWFNRRRGVALGLTMFGLGIGAITVPLVVQRLIAAYGWRSAYAAFGGAALLVSLPVVALFLKEDPEQKGLLPDGAVPAPGAVVQAKTREEGLSWHDTWHSRTFWHLIGAFFLAGASVHACILHMPALLTDRGGSAQAAAVASSIVGVALLLGRVGTGYLLDRIFAPRLAVIFFGGASIGIALLLLGSAGKLALVAAFLVGLGMGAEGDLIAYTLGRYFGLRAFGTTFGYAFGAFILAGAVGTLLMGVGFDLTHAYTVPLAGFFIAMLLAAVLMMLLGPYRYGPAHAAEGRPLAGVRAESRA